MRRVLASWRAPAGGRSLPGRRGLVTCAVVLASAGVLLAAGAVRYLPLLDDARSLEASARTLAADVRQADPGLDGAGVAVLRADVSALDGPLDRISSALAGDPVIGVLRSLPWAGEAVRDADTIADAARHVRAAAGIGLDLAGRYVAVRRSEPTTGTADTAARASESGSPADPLPAAALASSTLTTANAARPGSSGPLPLLVELMATSADSASAALDHLVVAERELLAMSPPGLGTLAAARTELLGEIDRVLPALEAYTKADSILPDVLGWTGKRRYIVLAQDPAELRPAGGFTGTIGVVGVDRGRIVELAFRDVYDLDLRAGVPFVEPPPALAAHLLGDRPWRLADANWSPDFPTSAADALRLYRLESGDRDIDGVVGLTTYAIDRLLRVTGPISVPGYAVTVRPGDATPDTLAATRQSSKPGENRKTFLGAFAGELLARLVALPPDRWADLVSALEDVRAERQAAAWMLDPRAEALIAASGWDGAIRTDPGDFLALVDADVAPASKLGAVVSRSIALDVRLDAFGNAADTAHVHWVNDITTPAAARYRSMPGFGDATVYATAPRLLVPERSRLVSFAGHGVVDPVGVDEVGTAAGRASIGTYLLVPPAGASLDASWTAPYVAATGTDGVVTYRLVVQKQPGTLADAVHVEIAIPVGATLVDASSGIAVSGDRLTFDGVLRADVALEVRYRLPSPSSAPPSAPSAPSSHAPSSASSSAPSSPASSPAPSGASIVPSH